MKRLAPAFLVLAFALSVTFVPFRHRMLVSMADGGFAFTERRIWAPLWDQPDVAAGVAEYPFAWLLGVWGALALAGVFGVAMRVRRWRARP